MSQSSSSKSVEKAKVTFEYEADNPDELTIKVGEIVEIVNKNTDNDGWWEVSWDDHFCILFVFFFFWKFHQSCVLDVYQLYAHCNDFPLILHIG